MHFRRLSYLFHFGTLRWVKLAVVLAVAFIEIESVYAIDFTIGAPEIVYTKSQRKSGGGSSWPDGSMGVIANGDGTYDIYAPNSSKIELTTGTLLDPGNSKTKVKITGVPKKTFSYLAGGPVFEDPYSGARLMIYHAEQGGKGKSFYSMLGMAISTDPEGKTFRDLGIIIRPNLPSGAAEVGGGSFAIVNGYMNVYYDDWMADGTLDNVAVARASMADIMTNALSGRPTAFTKYYNGSWSQPGWGGKASYLETLNPPNSWLSVSYNDYLNQVVMVSSQWSGDGGDLYYTTSPDGVNWAPRQPLAVDPGEQFYPTIIGTGADPTHSGQSFYVYYTDSQKGAWGRWKDAQLRRRAVTIGGPPGPVGSGNSLGYTADWVSISGFQSDFQSGKPSAGWTYAWDPKGKIGKSSNYLPLLWSNSAQAYNTTGGATTIPSPKAHHDDYLSFTDGGGHPGNHKYMPIAGYTIQADDGAGLYRLTDTSIQKTDGILATKEDGLQVLVYVNDTQIGDPQAVSTNGSLANFDRILGSLNVGDTVWVAIDPLKTQIDDAFFNFDFSLQKLVFYTQAAGSQLLQTVTVPEPSTALLALFAVAAFIPRRRKI
ncbi:MAG TPA: hypothetical protein VFW73_09385 [Lacipirellulaceae bacterium]|nr:hypothetical protein [Lacipirellulaceae bacterium]